MNPTSLFEVVVHDLDCPLLTPIGGKCSCTKPLVELVGEAEFDARRDRRRREFDEVRRIAAETIRKAHGGKP